MQDCHSLRISLARSLRNCKLSSEGIFCQATSPGGWCLFRAAKCKVIYSLLNLCTSYVFTLLSQIWRNGGSVVSLSSIATTSSRFSGSKWIGSGQLSRKRKRMGVSSPSFLNGGDVVRPSFMQLQKDWLFGMPPAFLRAPSKNKALK